MPTNHFDGVNEFGYVSIWEKIGEIDAGDGLKLPLHINFRSDREKVSPYLGYGWHFALLESSFTQVAENTFMMYEPAGLFRLFWRDGKNPTILNGQGGWKAEIRGDTITAVADCGGKLVFNRGRITSIQLKDRKFDFVYDGGALSEVRAGAVSLLRVEKEAITGEVTGVQLANNEQIAIERGQRPRIRTIVSVRSRPS